MEIKPIKLTIQVDFTNVFNLKNIYHLLPCVKIDNYIFTENGGIPFFGINGIFVSLKTHLWGCRGVRCQTTTGEHSGSMKNSVSLDYQYNNSNFNIKIFKNLAHLSGIISLDFGKQIALELENIFNHVNDLWKPFFLLNQEERYDFIQNVLIPMIFHEGTLLKYDSLILKERYESYNGDLKDPLRLFISFLDFYETTESFFQKIEIVYKLDSVDGNSITNYSSNKILNVLILEGIHNGSIPFENLSLNHIVTKLRKMNYDASFFNERSRSIKILDVNGLDEYKMRKSNSKYPGHQITLYDTGKIKVNSPATPELVKKIWNDMYLNIENIIKSDEYPSNDIDTILCSMKRISLEIHNKKLKEKLDNELYIKENKYELFLTN
jgi:hypothetical protein